MTTATLPAPTNATAGRQPQLPADPKTQTKAPPTNNKADPWTVLRPKTPVLTFNPLAWAKLVFMRDMNDAEVGGFGITEPGNPLHIIDFIIVKQQVSSVTVKFDDIAVADFFEDQVIAGRKPVNFGRIWCHTHPGDGATPSGTDEFTFATVFGRCDWAVMFILAKGGNTSARLRINGPGQFTTQVQLDIRVNWHEEFAGSDHGLWKNQYSSLVTSDYGSWYDDWGMGAAPQTLGPRLAASPTLTGLEASFKELVNFHPQGTLQTGDSELDHRRAELYQQYEELTSVIKGKNARGLGHTNDDDELLNLAQEIYELEVEMGIEPDDGSPTEKTGFLDDPPAKADCTHVDAQEQIAAINRALMQARNVKDQALISQLSDAKDWVYIHGPMSQQHFNEAVPKDIRPTGTPVAPAEGKQ